MESHLLQMRGLKPEERERRVARHRSHLLQMRGLKHKTITLNGVRQRRIFYRCVD